jgi:plastocyanin
MSKIMASLQILLLAALGSVVQATTSCPNHLASPTIREIPITWAHTHFYNSTKAYWEHSSSSPRIITHQPTLSATTSRLLPHLPWPTNRTQILAPTTTSVSRLRPLATVTVGRGGQLVFSPSSLNASAGSTIAFNFLGLNHTLTESEFQDPCHSNGGFDSGFAQFNPANASGKFVVEYQVMDETPRWFFCAQRTKRPHCQAGMVFSLNPGGRHAQFLENALAAVTLSPTQTGSFCQFPTLGASSENIGISSQPSGTVSARLGASSAVIFPPISNTCSSNGISYMGILLALAMM